MAKTYDNLEALIGNTPLVRLNKMNRNVPVGRWLREKMGHAGIKPFDLKSEIYAKLEYFNPGASVKDRIGLFIINGLEKSGALKPGGTVVEATSGNTGAGLALCCAVRGYKCVLVIPDKMSAEKINALRAYGADVVITPAKAAPGTEDHYTLVAKRLAKEIPGACLANQYFNPDNPAAHYNSTGPEIWRDMEGKIDLYCAGIGTGGTLSGTGRFLKEKNPNIRVIAADPYGSIYHDLVTKKKMGEAQPYLVEGVGEDEIPGTMDLNLPDDCVQVSDDESFTTTHVLAGREGIFGGGSCGLAVFATLQFLGLHELRGGKPMRAVVLIPDSGSRYLSKVYNEPWLEKNNLRIGWDETSRIGNVKYLPNALKVEGV